MVETQHFEDGVSVHTVTGEVTLLELAHAALASNLQYPSARVLWDFRACEVDLPSHFLTKSCATWFRAQVDHIHAERRAFIAHDDQLPLVETVLSRSRPPWPWAVFVNEGDALGWLTRAA